MNMNISPLGVGIPPTGPQAPPPTPPTGSQDRFESAPPAEDADRLRRAARTLTGENRMKKSETNYRPSSWTRAADGTMFIGYSESGQGKKGYLAAVDAKGRIAWELPLGDNKATHVGLLPDGRVQIGTPDGHLVCSAEGRLLETRTQGPAVRSHHQDSSGMHLEVLSGKDTLRAVGVDGQEIRLPSELTDIRARSVQATPEGGLMVLAGGKAVRLAPGGASASVTPLPEWPAEERTSYTAERAWGLAGGDVMVQRTSTMSTGIPRRPMGFPGGFGGHWDPDNQMPTYVTRTAFVRLAPDGTERWKTGEFPDTTRLLVNPDGSIFFNDSGRDVRRVSPEGKPEKILELADRADQFRAGSLPGTVLIRSQDQIIHLDSQGQTRGTVTLGDARRNHQLEGDLEDGRILFSQGGVLWACDATTGTWTRLTDLEVDHSTRPEDLMTPAPPEQAREISKGDGWIEIGDVRLPRR